MSSLELCVLGDEAECGASTSIEACEWPGEPLELPDELDEVRGCSGWSGLKMKPIFGEPPAL